jgi:non-heme chloroperoxidase
VTASHADLGPLSAQLLKNGTLKTYSARDVHETHAETINADLLAFLRER